MRHMREKSMGRATKDIFSTAARLVRLTWAPKQAPVLIVDASNADLLERLFREGTCQILDKDPHKMSLKALILTVLHFRRGFTFLQQYLGNYARLVDCLVVVTYRNNGVGHGAFKLRKPSVVSISFQNGVYDHERHKPQWSQKGMTGPDVAFGFGSQELNWFYSSLERRPLVFPAGSLRSNLVRRERGNSQCGQLVFISQWREQRASIDSSFYEPEAQILPFLSAWCANQKIALVILGCSKNNSKQEREFFEHFLEEGTFLFRPKEEEDWTDAYRQIDLAEIVVAVTSTLGREALLRGKKTCFFTTSQKNTTNSHGRIFSQSVLGHEHGPFWVSNGSLEEFERLLNRIRMLSEADYSESIGNTDWLGMHDPGLYKTRKWLIKVCPGLGDIVQPMSQAVWLR